MEAMGFVEVFFPFWYSRQCRVTVPWAASDCNTTVHGMSHECEHQDNTDASTARINETVSTNRVKQDGIKDTVHTTVVVRGAYKLVCIFVLGLQETWRHAKEEVTACRQYKQREAGHPSKQQWQVGHIQLGFAGGMEACMRRRR